MPHLMPVAPGRLSPRHFVSWAAALSVLVVFAIGELSRAGGARAVAWWANGGWTCSAVVALCGCLVAARRERASRRAWLFFAGGCASWLAGEIVWDYSQLVAHVALPFPSLGDAGWLGFVPLFIAGIFALPRPAGRHSIAILFGLDVAIVALALTLIGGVATQGLLLSASSLSLVGKGVALAYPVAYLTLGLAAFLLVLRVPRLAAARGMALLLLGLLGEGAGFVAWTPSLLNGAFQDGTVLDVVWMAGLLAIGLAGLEWRAPRHARATEADAPTLTLVALSLLPTVLGLGVALIVPSLVHGTAHGRIDLGARALIALVALRQLAAVVENARLYRSEATQRGLAQRRAERLRRVQELGRTLHLDLDSSGVGQLTVDAACAALGFRLAVLNLIDDLAAPPAERRIRAVATAGLSPEVATRFLTQDAPASDTLSLLRDEFRLSRSYFVPAERMGAAFGGTSIPQWTPDLAPATAGGWCAGDELLVPLIERRTDNFLGFLSVDDPIDGRRPDAEVAEILEIFADQAALAIENSRLYERAQAQALRDPVTGLANHRAVHQALDAALGAGGRRGCASFLLVDVDNFKLFNDTYGHPTGDAVLRAIAGRLQACVREGGVVGRYGGDEFALVLPGADRAAADAVARRIDAAVRATPYVSECGAVIPLSLSVGAAMAPDDGATRQALLAVADARMYATKSGATADPIMVRSAADLLGDTAFGILEGLVAAVDAKDRYTREHSLDVTRYALMLADALGLPDDDRRTLAIAGPLHDVGKIAIPDRVLRKPGGLTDEEYEAIKSHVTYGVAIVRGLLDDARVIDTIAQHHERHDGRGYPQGLRGEETPLLGRIMQIADAVSAMTLDRPYRRGLSTGRVVAELRRGVGAQFDPTLVEPFIVAFCASRADAPDLPVGHDACASPSRPLPRAS
jgi:diguanylate cyclase (GGDEF)-like protein/putative nucleotidyltransferase with HDIG domain